MVLLDEMVLPSTNVSSYAAGIDLTMMTATAAHERTEKKWQEVVEASSLKITKTYCYNPTSYETILELVPV